MSTSNPFRRKMAEDRDRSARSSLEDSRPPTLSSGDDAMTIIELSPTTTTKSAPPSIITTESTSTSTLTSLTSPPRIPPPVSSRVAKRRSQPPPPPPPARNASRRVSPVIEPRPAPPPPPPSPPVATVEPETEGDPFEEASEPSDDDEEVVVKDKDEEDEEPSVIVPLSPPPISRTPSGRQKERKGMGFRPSSGALNPFRKPSDLIPNKRQSFDISSIRFGTGKVEPVVDNEAQRAPVRQSLDVDAFKRLILTGTIDPIEDGPGSGKGAQLPHNAETRFLGGMIEKMGPVVNGDLKSCEEAISSISEVGSVWTESIGETPPARQDGSAVMIEAPVAELPRTTLTPPPALNMTPTSSARVKPPPPRPRIRPSGSPHSGSSSSMQQMASPASSSTTSLATPISSSPSSLPSLANSSVVLGDYLDTRQPPLPTSSHEERAQSPKNVPSPSVLMKPLPPSPPLSRMDSKRRSTLSPSSMAAGSLSRSNSASRRPPPPPARRVQSSSFTSPTSDLAMAAPIAAIDTSPPSADGLPTSAKPFSPPPPPPRGTRRKGALGESSSLTSPLGGLPPPIPILQLGLGVERLGGGDVISTEPITPGTWAGGKHEEDILADLESLQREVDKLKGMVEGRSGVVL
ncbi:hypothetical protein L211DRAFT_434070 [Terfezia boudieri ATCC MYA-4762]|uniref:Uncharacterized protein n=1 Tax=Terfezia boudieri ATCC MYA-4762 TaxID=1051890 RepID=A0A3N4LEY2_9PEZI|nr:hypothetical protein L211DRAFT_434070 [Terfezia boudieri ATCC MYA-4762]